MSCLDDKAREVCATLRPSHGMEAGVGDTPFLDFLRELFTNLLPLLLGCLPMAQRNAAGLAAAMNRPTLRQRAGLLFYLARNMDDPRTGNLRVGEVKDALHKMGQGCNEADAEAMMQEVA